MSRVSRRTMMAGAGVSIAVYSAVATPSIMARPAQAAGVDSPLFDLCRRWREAEAEVTRLIAERDRLCSLLPPTVWTPEELAEHRIDGSKDKPLFITQNDVKRSNHADDPGKPQREVSETDDGTTYVQTYVLRRRTPTDDEISAWRSRCAARQALFDSKRAALKDARLSLGYEAVEDRIDAACTELDRLSDAIEEFRPQTVAGALEKLRVFREDVEGQFGGDPEDLEWPARLFLTALSDLERLTGGGAA